MGPIVPRNKAISKRKGVLAATAAGGSVAVALFASPVLGVLGLAGAVALFTQIGAEFVPQLDEGDLLVEARRLPGVALSESVETDRRLQAAILRVPEVTQVVSKTGAPELATDPMGIEQTDVYIGLKDRSEWRPGLDKEGL
ncbi:MAG TPA: efflux RND transporter permease subunit, partial [Kofleriaceae bacterium]|nr:efflux RND transporter permease subunit [Kofleriaceae bacterium]